MAILPWKSLWCIQLKTTYGGLRVAPIELEWWEGTVDKRRNHTALAAWTENSGPCTGKKMSWTLWSSHLELFSHLLEMVMISWRWIANRVQWVLSYCVHTDTRTIGTIEHTALWNSLPQISITDLCIHDGRNSGNPWLRLSHPESKGPDPRRCSPVCSCWCRVDWHLGTQVFYFTPRILILHCLQTGVRTPGHTRAHLAHLDPDHLVQWSYPGGISMALLLQGSLSHTMAWN